MIFRVFHNHILKNWYLQWDLNPQGQWPTNFKSVAFTYFAMEVINKSLYLHRPRDWVVLILSTWKTKNQVPPDGIEPSFRVYKFSSWWGTPTPNLKIRNFLLCAVELISLLLCHNRHFYLRINNFLINSCSIRWTMRASSPAKIAGLNNKKMTNPSIVSPLRVELRFRV